MSSDDARTLLLRAEIERLKELLREKGFEAREIRTLFDDEATAPRNAELRGSRLQTALTATQRELKSCMERATRAEEKLEESAPKDKSKAAAGV